MRPTSFQAGFEVVGHGGEGGKVVLDELLVADRKRVEELGWSI